VKWDESSLYCKRVHLHTSFTQVWQTTHTFVTYTKDALTYSK
jgi:hypothetical protein